MSVSTPSFAGVVVLLGGCFVTGQAAAMGLGVYAL